MKTQKQVIISIGREFGSAGHEIAERIAKRYGLSLYDHNLLREVADSHNVSSEELEIFDEMKHNKFLYRTVKGMSSSPPGVCAVRARLSLIRALPLPNSSS